MVGLVWGLVVPNTPYPRLALGAHIQFETNGILLIVLALLVLKLPSRLGPKSLWLMIVTAWLTWAMALSEAANAWWGTQKMLPIAAAQAGASGGAPWQEAVVGLTHILAGLALIAAWGALIWGLLGHHAADEPAPT